MKSFLLLCSLYLLSINDFAQSGGIEILVRGDDIGSSHAANVACIESYRNGIMKSVELMVPGPWFPETVKMLQENPGLDVGVQVAGVEFFDDYCASAYGMRGANGVLKITLKK